MIDPIREFWRWWAGCDRPDAASVDGHIRAMDAGLGWEFSGFTATARNRSLTVHSNGDPTLRALAARWAAAAVPTAGWKFRAARPATPAPLSGLVTVDGVRIDLSRLRFDATPSPHRPEIDVTGVHPAFDAVDPEAAGRVTELALADVLGETRLDLWIGGIAGRGVAVARVGPVAGEPGEETGQALLRYVDGFAALERWRTWSRIGDAAVRWPLRGARWPRFDTHLAVAGASPDLVRALGEGGDDAGRADCAVVAWEDGGRIAHVYADGATGAPALVEAYAGRGAVIERGYDPTLREVRHLAGLYGHVEGG